MRILCNTHWSVNCGTWHISVAQYKSQCKIISISRLKKNHLKNTIHRRVYTVAHGTMLWHIMISIAGSEHKSFEKYHTEKSVSVAHGTFLWHISIMMYKIWQLTLSVNKNIIVLLNHNGKTYYRIFTIKPYWFYETGYNSFIAWFTNYRWCQGHIKCVWIHFYSKIVR